jgi:Protein of unknown function (DUF2794)
MANLFRFPERRRAARPVYFDRRELSQILNLYSRRVASGEWRDYAIDHCEGVATFSVFRHTHERPLFSILKIGGAGNRPVDYAVITGRQKLKDSSSLAEVLSVFERKLRVVVD